MGEEQAASVPTEMAEFYDCFYDQDGGTLLPTTMPAGILDVAFRFDHDPAETSLRPPSLLAHISDRNSLSH